jgi:hypothetical protein
MAASGEKGGRGWGDPMAVVGEKPMAVDTPPVRSERFPRSCSTYTRVIGGERGLEQVRCAGNRWRMIYRAEPVSDGNPHRDDLREDQRLR